MHLLNYISRQNFAFAGMFIIIVSLIASRYMLSLGMIMLVLTGLFSVSAKDDFISFLKNKPSLIISSLFFLCLISGFFSGDYTYFAERIRIKLPFLVLPLAFSLLKPFSEKRFYLILIFYIITMTATAIGVLMNYLINYDYITHSYIYARVLPTPINHIHFSLMCAFAVIVGIFLYTKKIFYFFPLERILIIASTVFLFFFLHIFAVRSGLIALYAALFGMIGWYFITRKKFLSALLWLLLVLGIPIAAYQIIPTFKSKINYTLYDFEMYKKGTEPSDYSDGGRIYSYKVASKIIKENFLFGVGYGNLKNEMYKIYERDYPQIKQERRLMPHNEFLFFFAAMGLTGMIYLVFVFFFPLFYQKNYNNLLLLCFHLILFTAFMVESYIEDQIGTAFYLLILLLLLKQNSAVYKTSENQLN